MKGIIMPKNSKTPIYVVTTVHPTDAQIKQYRTEARKRFIKNFAIGAAIGFTIVTIVQTVAEACKNDDENQNED